MTKFEDIFPDAEHLDQVEFKGSDLLFCHGKIYDKYCCWHCGEPTNWIDINFEVPLCSEECFNVEWNEYFESSSNREVDQYEDCMY